MADRPHNILVFGGTQMLGRDFVENLIQDPKYKITLANRAITNPNLFPNINHTKIDRNDKNSCSILSKNGYDSVIDFSCYNITQFNNTFNYLSYTRYILISTQSVLEKQILDKADQSDPYYRYCFFKKEIEDFFSLNLDEQRKFREGCFSYSKKNTHKILLEMVVDILDKSKTSSSVLDNKSEELNYNISKKIVKDLTFGLFNAIDSYTYNDKEMKLFLLGKLIQSLYGRQ